MKVDQYKWYGVPCTWYLVPINMYPWLCTKLILYIYCTRYQEWYLYNVQVSCMEHHAFYVFSLWTKQDNPCSPTNIKLLSGMLKFSYTALTHWDWILRLDEYKYLLNQMINLTRNRMLMYRHLMKSILPNKFQRKAS